MSVIICISTQKRHDLILSCKNVNRKVFAPVVVRPSVRPVKTETTLRLFPLKGRLFKLKQKIPDMRCLTFSRRKRRRALRFLISCDFHSRRPGSFQRSPKSFRNECSPVSNGARWQRNDRGAFARQLGSTADLLPSRA